MIDLEKLEKMKAEEVEILLTKSELLRNLDVTELITRTIFLDDLPSYHKAAARGKKFDKQRMIELGFGEELKETRRGAVYVFHLPKDRNGKEVGRDVIVKAVKANKDKGRTLPSLENIEHREYTSLYVGCIKSSFKTRFIQHLGYGTPNTGALQLLHWAKPLFNEIQMSYIPIEFSQYGMHALMEFALNKTHIPMIGRIERSLLNP